MCCRDNIKSEFKVQQKSSPAYRYGTRCNTREIIEGRAGARPFGGRALPNTEYSYPPPSACHVSLRPGNKDWSSTIFVTAENSGRDDDERLTFNVEPHAPMHIHALVLATIDYGRVSGVPAHAVAPTQNAIWKHAAA